jgi:rhomboid protease GluP
MPPRWYEAWLRSETSSLSWAICLVWLAVFYAEQRFSIVPGQGLEPTNFTDTALGALDWTSVSRGQWWRFFTNPFLHGGPNHFRWDILALLGVGPTFQSLVGRSWYGATFAVVALASGATSLLTLPAFPGTVGPMGVVMGILTANFVCGFHFKEPALRARVWHASAFSLVVSLIDTFRRFEFPVDIGGHLAGATAGAIVGCALLLSWPQSAPRPILKRVAQVVLVLFLLGGVSGCGMVMLHYKYYVREVAGNMPASAMRLDMVHAMAKSEEYVTRYPSDPWAHLLHGNYFYNLQNYTSAEGEFRTGLRLAEGSQFPPFYVDHARAMLAITLWHEGFILDAKKVAAPSCHSRNPDPFFRQMLKSLQDARACES